jgi:hypothetical protein
VISKNAKINTKTPHSTKMCAIICNYHPSSALFSDLLKEFCHILFEKSDLRNSMGDFRVFFGSSEILEQHSTSLSVSPGLEILFPKTQLASPKNKMTVPKQIILYSNHLLNILIFCQCLLNKNSYTKYNQTGILNDINTVLKL